MKKMILGLGMLFVAGTANAATIGAGNCRPIGNGLCEVRIDVRGDGYSRQQLAVFVSNLQSRETKLFACFDHNGGSERANWIARNNTYRFTLVEAEDCHYGYGRTLDEVTVRFGGRGWDGDHRGPR